MVTPREGDAVALHAPSPPDAPPARPFSHGQRTEYVAQDDTAPQWVRAPEQRVYRVPRCCGRDPASGRGPGGHGGRAAARATLPPRARQKGLVLASASASTGGGFSPMGEKPQPQTSPPRALHPAWARGTGFLDRYGLSWHSPADGYTMMARCLRGWPAVNFTVIAGKRVTFLPLWCTISEIPHNRSFDRGG